MTFGCNLVTFQSEVLYCTILSIRTSQQKTSPAQQPAHPQDGQPLAVVFGQIFQRTLLFLLLSQVHPQPVATSLQSHRISCQHLQLGSLLLSAPPQASPFSPHLAELCSPAPSSCGHCHQQQWQLCQVSGWPREVCPHKFQDPLQDLEPFCSRH